VALARELANSVTAWLNVYARAESSVKIYIEANCKDVTDRIELSSGTRVADASDSVNLPGGIVYEDGARVPREPWRPPTAQEAESLIATELPRNMANAIAIVRLPGEFSNELGEAIRNVSTETLEADVLQPLRKICELGEPVHCHGFNANPANLKTLTINREINRFIGLHVDSWDGMELNARHLATNRICMNIGNSDRYFLFVPISLMDIVSLLAKEMGPDWQVPRRYTDIGRQFLARFPEVPTVRCRLTPGEAYIAPTENLVHDGSSLGQTEMDERFTIRGHIRPL
jgi:hypothetical protein